MLTKNCKRIHAAISRKSSDEYLQALRKDSAFARRRIAKIHAAIRPHRKTEIESKETMSGQQEAETESSKTAEENNRKRRHSVASKQEAEGKRAKGGP
jgi:hypothetical protein